MFGGKRYFILYPLLTLQCICVLEELWVGQGGLVEWEMGRQLKCSEAVYSGKVAIFFFFLQKTTKFTSTARKAKRIKVTLCVELSFPPSATLPFGP